MMARVTFETGMNEEFVTALVNVRNALDRRLERSMCREEVRGSGYKPGPSPLDTPPYGRPTAGAFTAGPAQAGHHRAQVRSYRPL